MSSATSGRRFAHLLPDTDLGQPDEPSGPVYNQVDAQPLVVHGVHVGDPSSTDPGASGSNPNSGNGADGDRDVVYLATEANYVFAIDGASGRILKTRHFKDPPVNYPNGCLNNAAYVGITSTPAIDLRTQTMFLVNYADTQHGHAYFLHKLSLSTLEDEPGSPVEIKARAQLPNGQIVQFDANYERQRAALLLHDGLLYVGFASFCDEPRDKTRGWLMAWFANSLAPFPLTNDAGAPQPLLVNKTSSDAAQEFLSGIWMSGAGPASDDSGDVYFVTGNSSRAPNTYDPQQNLSESFVRYSPWDKKVVSYFTPANVKELDENDQDFGAGGPVLLPGRVAGLPDRLALAAGKDGRLFLLDRDDLGGFQTGVEGGDRVAGVAQTTNEGEECRCNTIVMPGPHPLVAIGAGTNLSLFEVGQAGGPLRPVGHQELQDDHGATANAPFGFGITGSSNGAADPIVWAVSRPISSSDPDVFLYAFDASKRDPDGGIPLLTRQYAGEWPFTYATTGVVPVVANGTVYVATMGKLLRFGLVPVGANEAGAPPGAAGPGTQPGTQPGAPGGPGGGNAPARFAASAAPPRPPEMETFQVPLPHAFSTRLTGYVTELNGPRMRLRTIMRQEFRVDIGVATEKHRLPVVLRVGTPVQVLGDRGHDKKGVVIYGRVVNDAGDSTRLWLPDVLGDTSG